MAETKEGDNETSLCKRLKTTISSYLPIAGKNIQYSCEHCQKEINQSMRFHCTTCPHVVLCMDCFTVNASSSTSIPGHDPSEHGYQVSDCLSFPLCSNDWTVGEELLLLEGIDMFGLGNWKSISEHVGSKTDKKCQFHYMQDYLKSPHLPLPLLLEEKYEIALQARKKEEERRKELEEETHKKQVEEEERRLKMQQEKNAEEKEAPADEVGGKEQVEGKEQEESKEQDDVGQEQQDDIMEVDDSTVLKENGENNIQMAVEEPPSTPVLKKPSDEKVRDPANPAAHLPGADLAGYMPLRGDFDVEHDNDAELILADMEFMDSDHPTERELKLRIIDIYNGKLDERERRKKFVIERGLLDYKHHQQLERRRPKDERELVSQMRPFARFQSAAEHNEFVEGLLTAMRLRKRIATLQNYRKNGIRTLAEADEYEAQLKKKESELALQKSREGSSYLYDSGRTQSGGKERASRWLSREKGPTPHEEGSEKGSTHTTTSAKGSSVSTSMDLSSAPGLDLLTAKEIELCSSLRLLPKHYMVIKDTLIRESFRLGYLDKKTARQMAKIDINKTGKIYDFFVSSGWVSNNYLSQPGQVASSSSLPSTLKKQATSAEKKKNKEKKKSSKESSEKSTTSREDKEDLMDKVAMEVENSNGTSSSKEDSNKETTTSIIEEGKLVEKEDVVTTTTTELNE